MHVKKEKLISYLFPLLLGLVLFAGGFAWYMIAGFQNDDILYMHEFTGEQEYSPDFRKCRGELITTAEQVVSSAKLHYLYWGNARLGSLYMFASNLWPRWITCLIDALGLAALFLAVMRMGLGREALNRSLWCMIIAGALWWALPWHEFMLTSSFAINYVVASAVIVWLLMLIDEQRGNPVWVCLLALIAGALTESLSLTAAIFLICLCIKRYTSRGNNKQMLLPVIFFLVGTAFVSINPSMLDRTQGIDFLHEVYWRKILQFIIFRQWPLLLAGIIIVVRKLRNMHWVLPQITLPVVVAALITGFLSFMGNDRIERVNFMSLILQIILLVRLTRDLRVRGGKRIKLIAAYILLLIMGAWMGAVACVQYKYSGELKYIEQRWKQTRSPIIIATATTRLQSPWWALGLPLTVYDSLENLSYHLYSVHGMESGPLIVVIDPRDEARSITDWQRLPGSAGIFKGMGATLFSPEKIGDGATFTFALPAEGEVTAPEQLTGNRIPWYAFRQMLEPGKVSQAVELRIYESAIAKKDFINFAPKLLSAKRAECLEGDTLYFYYMEYFLVPRRLQGLAITDVEKWIK